MTENAHEKLSKVDVCPLLTADSQSLDTSRTRCDIAQSLKW